MEYLALALAGLGLLLVLLAVMFERPLGSTYTTGAIAAGFVSEILALALGLQTREQPAGLLASLVAGASLLWAIVTYVRFRAAMAKVVNEEKERARRNQNLKGESSPCVPRHVLGEGQVFSSEGKYQSWRDYLLFVHSTVAPSDSGMPLKNWAAGGAYYGLWYRAGKAEAKSDLQVKCHSDQREEECEDQKCKIVGSVVGPIEAIDGVVRVYTAVSKSVEVNFPTESRHEVKGYAACSNSVGVL